MYSVASVKKKFNQNGPFSNITLVFSEEQGFKKRNMWHTKKILYMNLKKNTEPPGTILLSLQMWAVPEIRVKYTPYIALFCTLSMSNSVFTYIIFTWKLF